MTKPAPVSHPSGGPPCRCFRFVISSRLSGVFAIPIGATSLHDAIKVQWDSPPQNLGPLDVAAFRRARDRAIEQFRAEGASAFTADDSIGCNVTGAQPAISPPFSRI